MKTKLYGQFITEMGCCVYTTITINEDYTMNEDVTFYERNGGIDMMREEDFTKGEYVKKEDVMMYLKVFNWNMSREELFEKLKEMQALKVTEHDINKVKINKFLSGEWK